MARPQFSMTWAAEDTAAALKAQSRQEGRADRRLRLHGLWLLRQGRSVADTAAVVGVHRRTVDRWVDWYRTEGLAGVLRRRAGGHGHAAWLSPAQAAQVVAEVATGRFRSAAEIGAWIATTFHVHFRRGGVTSLLRRLRARPKVPRPRHANADPAAQVAWKKGG